MEGRRTKTGRAPRTLATLTGALLAAAFACPAAGAQLTDLLEDQPVQLPVQLPDEPVQQALEPVQRAVDEPLPEPVEEVVQESPVGPVRDQVRDVVRGVTGGGGGGGGGGSTGGGNSTGSGSSSGSAPAGGQAAPSTGTAPPAGGDRTTEPRRRTDRAGGGGADRNRGGESPGGAQEPAAADGASEVAGAGGDEAGRTTDRGTRRQDAAAETKDEERGPLARTVDRIVHVVPTPVWIAVGALALIALAMGGRALLFRRRAQALEEERERLLRDMGLLERVLLPQVPERMGDLAASVAYRPSEGPAAGGDFYDVFELPEGRVAVVVGDISGHGPEALERTGSLRPTLRGHLEVGLSPRAALRAAGDFAGLDPNGGFTTVVIALHDPGAGTLAYAAAGHPPPILVGRAADEPLTVVSSPPIGVGLRTGMRQTTVPLPRGSSACFFTDGLLEARSGGSQLGTDWLKEVVAGLGPLDSAEVLLDRVLERADETPDDMTACLLRAVAGSEALPPRVEELELEVDELRSATAERFLAACGVPAEAMPALLAKAERTGAASGGAVFRVVIDGSGAAATVTDPAPEVLATS